MKPTAAAPVLPLASVNGSGELYLSLPDGKGGLGPREPRNNNYRGVRAAAQVDHDGNGLVEGAYFLTDKHNLYYETHGGRQRVASSWGQYDTFFSPGDLGGIGPSDILVRDTAGVMWLYLAYPDGTLTTRHRVGGGWNAFTSISGRGDLTGDGRTDVVARDGDGVLWLYKGTGDYKRPLDPARVRIGGGWNEFDKLVSTGDVDLDGHADVLARGKDGNLWLYRGTGNATAPLKLPRVKIGASNWGQFTLMF